jgi:hypothetical protein
MQHFMNTLPPSKILAALKLAEISSAQAFFIVSG